jgi:hypothetical protein
VKQKLPDQIISGAGDYKTVSFSRYLEPVTTSIRTGDFSYYYDKQKDTFDIYPNHPLYIQQRKIASDWYQKGLIDQDIIMRNSEQYSQLVSSGKMVMFDSPWISEADAIRSAVPEAELEVLAWTIAGTKPAPYQNQILITEKSKIKDRVVTFFDWVWSDQANYNLVMYGIEGTHFNVVDGKISYPEGVTAATSEFPSPWDTVFQNNGMFLFNTAWDPIVENSLRALWDFQGYSVDEMAGFNPDLSMFNDVIPTQARYMDEYLQKTLLGALDVDTATKELYDNWLKTCRGEEQIEELTKQYKAWLAQ